MGDQVKITCCFSWEFYQSVYKLAALPDCTAVLNSPGNCLVLLQAVRADPDIYFSLWLYMGVLADNYCTWVCYQGGETGSGKAGCLPTTCSLHHFLNGGCQALAGFMGRHI